MTSFMQVQSLLRAPPMSRGSSFLNRNIILPKKPQSNRREPSFIPNTKFKLNFWVQTENGGEMVHRKENGAVCKGFLFPVDPWAPTIDSQSIASQLFAFSLFPYIGFLYFITKSKSAPKLTLFGFYFLLAFVGATIPAGIYAKVHYGISLSNVDWLHGGAESLLTLTNLFIVLGLREAIRKATDKNDKNLSNIDTSLKENEKSSL